jgi:hypothetical protein
LRTAGTVVSTAVVFTEDKRDLNQRSGWPAGW